MKTASDAFFKVFGLPIATCENCTHALPCSCYPLVYCPVKGKPVQKFERCREHQERKK